MTNDFLSFAVSNGMNSAHVEHAMASSMQSFTPMARAAGYINPAILEERKLNVTQMDVDRKSTRLNSSHAT